MLWMSNNPECFKIHYRLIYLTFFFLSANSPVNAEGLGGAGDAAATAVGPGPGRGGGVPRVAAPRLAVRVPARAAPPVRRALCRALCQRAHAAVSAGAPAALRSGRVRACCGRCGPRWRGFVCARLPSRPGRAHAHAPRTRAHSERCRAASFSVELPVLGHDTGAARARAREPTAS